MGILNGIRKINVPGIDEVVTIPSKIRNEADNQKINQIKVKFFDRFFKKCFTVNGIKEHKTSIPIVYFDKPDKLGVILFDDCTYIDENGFECVDVCEDYPFGLNHATEHTIINDLKIQYYNDMSENKLGQMSKEMFEKNGMAYYIPVMLNRIPREIIRIETKQKLNLIDDNYITHKTEITAYLVRQLSKVKMLERVGKKDNSAIVIGVILGILIGAVITFSFVFLTM